MITIINYGAGNIGSVDKAFKFIGEEVKVSDKAEDILAAEALVLPGVGAFEDAMRKIKSANLDGAIEEYIKKDRPFLGICLGMQMLFDYSEEAEKGEKAEGLKIFPGSIKRFSENKGLKIPQMGWNSISFNGEKRMFKGMSNREYVYFVHSYYLKSDDEDLVSAKCGYGIDFDAAVERGNVFAAQFHPEKSGEAGLKILRNFAEVKNGYISGY